MSSRSTALRLNFNLQLVPPRWLYFCMFTVSGFSGLIYESIWSHYLKLFLGHAAYAQSLVLIIFMGGMAGGAWLASRYSDRWKTPLLAYVAVEVIIGLMALVFHNVFQGMIDGFYLSILPGLDSPTLGSVLKWSAAATLILPQSILLGMTFPLMSAGILRRYPSTPGGSLAMLYFTNSIGAAIGVLASGFWLIGLVGLPGTIFTAGLLNIALAVGVWILLKVDPESAAAPLPQDAEESTEQHTLSSLFLTAAFITGAASFIYEIGWIRMLSLVLGSTTHSFELMLSAFITGLAFGGLWIKKRIDHIDDPVAFSGGVQILMGSLAVLTLPVYFASFDWMAGLMAALSPTESGFVAFSFGSHLIALAVMLPATFLAGMTLPLFTHVLIQKGGGEKTIGRIYAANTFGAICGVLFAIHIGLPLLGLKSLIAFGAALDIILGVFLLSRAAGGRRRPQIAAVAIVGFGAIAIVMSLVQFDPARLTSGVYRHGKVDAVDGGEILFYRDGKTASISLGRAEDNSIFIATNGKPDASLFIDDGENFTADELTMVLAGALPLAYKTDAKIIGNIGLGSGLTTHTLLTHDAVEVVDTIEIEPVMVLAAQGFGERVARTFSDPRSQIHIEDAKTFFSLSNRRYDIIVAEPSNPWVSGVSSLFTQEFYNSITNYLVEDGLFVQWIQLYEFEDRLIFSILKALAPNFDDYAIYAAGGADILVIAKRTGELGEPAMDRLLRGSMGDEFRRLDVSTVDDLRVRKLANKRAIDAMFSYYRVPANSDYYPFLDLNAGQARFKRKQATLFHAWSDAPLPILEMIFDETFDFGNVYARPDFPRTRSIGTAAAAYDTLTGQADTDASVTPQQYFVLQNVRLALQSCGGATMSEVQLAWFQIAANSLPFLDPARAVELVQTVSNADCLTMTDAERVWAGLYLAVAGRDAAGMAEAGMTLIDMPGAISLPEQAVYVFSAAMLGLLESGRSAQALELWRAKGESAIGGQNVPSYTTLILQLAGHDAG